MPTKQWAFFAITYTGLPSTYSVEDIFIQYSVQKIKMTCKYVKGTV